MCGCVAALCSPFPCHRRASTDNPMLVHLPPCAPCPAAHGAMGLVGLASACLGGFPWGHGSGQVRGRSRVWSSALVPRACHGVLSHGPSAVPYLGSSRDHWSQAPACREVPSSWEMSDGAFPAQEPSCCQPGSAPPYGGNRATVMPFLTAISLCSGTVLCGKASVPVKALISLKYFINEAQRG